MLLIGSHGRQPLPVHLLPLALVDLHLTPSPGLMLLLLLQLLLPLSQLPLTPHQRLPGTWP